MQKSENNRAGELKELGWSAEDVRRYEELWEYRQRWGAINLERDDRQFLRKAEAALPKIVAKGSEKKRTQDKSLYRWLAFYLEAMQSAPLNEGEVAAWPIVLQEELRTIDYYEPVLGLPDTLKAKELLPVREQLVAQAAATAVRSISFDFVAPLEELKQREKTSWKPLRGDSNTDTTYPVLSADAADAFRQQARATITSTIRELFPSLKDTEKPEPPADWMP
ncbi:hypothetical protein [Vulcanococcus sp.]|uniref:hypothetical protein n=1 Tax=Vulcanococcus sp. TaxID=2856995 RepID=UPI003F696D33